MENNALRTYFNWSCNAILGSDPVASDHYLRANMDDVKLAAQYLLNQINYKPVTLYRGVIMQQPINQLDPHPNFTYLSFSEDKKIAYGFSNPEADGFGSLFYLGDFGYVAEYTPKLEEILFHHSFLEMLPYAQALFNIGVDGSRLHEQKEVTILQPFEPFTNITDYKTFKTLL